MIGCKLLEPVTNPHNSSQDYLRLNSFFAITCVFSSLHNLVKVCKGIIIVENEE